MEINKFRLLASQKISGLVNTRLPLSIKTLICKGIELITDIHIHIFNRKSVPAGIFIFKFSQVGWDRFLSFLSFGLRTITPFRKDSATDKTSRFIKEMDSDSVIIFNNVKNIYPTDTVFCVLMMDLHNKNRGFDESADNYIRLQWADICNLIDKGENILPFLCIDPSYQDGQRNCLDLFLEFFSGVYGKIPFGIKIYPSLGYLPSHPLLMEIFAICEQKDIPVIAHCSSGTIHNHKRLMTNIEGLRYKNGQFVNCKEWKFFANGNVYAEYFNSPNNWTPVLSQFKNLRLNLAHFGGAEQIEKHIKHGNSWVTKIIELCENYPNVYSDLSYTLACASISDIKYIYESTIMKEKFLHGTDLYMILNEGNQRNILDSFVIGIGSEMYEKLQNNNRKFLSI